MPNCVVKGCKNQTSRDKKPDGITFHVFPKRNQNMKEKWIAVLRHIRGESSWLPTNRSVVCSAHFNSDDLYYTKKGLRCVVKNRYPKILPNIIEESVNIDERPSNIILPNVIEYVDVSQLPSIKEEPPAPNLSNDLTQPSLCVKEEPSAPNLSNDLLGVNHSSIITQPTSCVKEEPPALYLSNYLNLSHPTSSCAVPAVHPLSAPRDSSIPDIVMEHKLRERVLKLEKRLKISQKKIKTLHQKVRRLHKRNKYLRQILDNLGLKKNLKNLIQRSTTNGC